MSKRITRAIAAYREVEPHAIINRAAMNAAINVDDVPCFECHSPLMTLCLECNPRYTDGITLRMFLAGCAFSMIVGGVFGFLFSARYILHRIQPH